MDITDLKNIIQKQLSGTSGLSSLQLQNHIYGCFLIMEDIAQNVLEYSEHQLIGPSYSFNAHQYFSDIGIRYGFVMDTKLALTNYLPSYKDIWLQTFQDLSVLKDIEIVDTIEECLIEVIQHNVSAEDAYFIHALETGSLPQQWIGKVLSLLQPAVSIVSDKTSEDESSDKQSSVISRARTEKPIIKSKRLARTYRHTSNVEPATKKYLSKTRKKL